MTASTYKLLVLYQDYFEKKKKKTNYWFRSYNHTPRMRIIRILTDSPINYAQLSERAFNF